MRDTAAQVVGQGLFALAFVGLGLFVLVCASPLPDAPSTYRKQELSFGQVERRGGKVPDIFFYVPGGAYEWNSRYWRGYGGFIDDLVATLNQRHAATVWLEPDRPRIAAVEVDGRGIFPDEAYANALSERKALLFVGGFILVAGFAWGSVLLYRGIT